MMRCAYYVIEPITLYKDGYFKNAYIKNQIKKTGKHYDSIPLPKEESERIMDISEEYITKDQAMKAYCEHFCHPGPRCPDGYCKEVRDAFGPLESVAFIIEEELDVST